MVDQRGIRARWILAFDGRDQVVLENGVVEWDGGTITRVGRTASLSPEQVTDLPGHLLFPGFVNLHSHSGSQASGRLIFHQGRRDYFGGGFQNTLPRAGAQRVEGTDPKIGALATLAELAKGGATTALDAGFSGGNGDALLAAREQVPIRLILGPAIRAKAFGTDDQGRILQQWDDDRGLGALERALRWLEALPNGGKGDGMVTGVLYPHILDYVTAELLAAAKQEADSRGLLLQIHAGQSLYEFHEIVHRTGMTPVEWLESLGVLGPRTSLAHCFATTAHPMTAWPAGRDLEILAKSHTTVVHCPVAIGRRGNWLQSLDGYQRAGVRVAIGTDSFPRDMLAEMRAAQAMAKQAEHDFAAGSAQAVIRATTIDAADAIGRPDLGRIAVGSAADLVAVNLHSLAVGPVRDPVDAALCSANARDITHVVVNGRFVVRDGRIPGLDEDALVDQLQAEGEHAWASVPEYHWTRLSADTVFPRSFRVAGEDEFR